MENVQDLILVDVILDILEQVVMKVSFRIVFVYAIIFNFSVILYYLC